MHSISFQTFLVQAFKFVVVLKIQYVIAIHVMRWLTNFFMISSSNKQLQQELEYTLLKPDCHSWWISKMHSGREEERYAIKFCFKLGKNVMRWKLDLPLWTWTKRQSSQWKNVGSPRPKKVRQSKSTHKLLMIHFLTALAWSTYTGFPLNWESKRNTMLRF